ncbi:hypothetical protein [Streptomyces chartreusis]|uniref:hypothetical protein n=1 Tax=Streptomyces chartreusis TaxID=1969 RepID=UPI00123DA2A1|nr:hypothetical protein [Streptomyces chartreusis]QEV68334.1 hypothetical protein CP983_17715 [Streptomyces chartreusis]GGX35111.1 hypothetical protein GCM10010321_58100 [Streptomyces chartreusis]
MGNSDLRRLDREIRATTKKLEAVRNGEWWPLTARERLAMSRALASGARSVTKGRSTGRAEQQMDTTGSAAETRLSAELSGLYVERRRLIAESRKKKSSRWF